MSILAFPPGGQKWIKSQDYGTQMFEQSCANKHKYSQQMADRKRQAASDVDLGHSCRGLT